MDVNVGNVEDEQGHPDQASSPPVTKSDSLATNNVSSSVASPIPSLPSEVNPITDPGTLLSPTATARSVLHISSGKASVQQERTAQWQAEVSTQLSPSDASTSRVDSPQAPADFDRGVDVPRTQPDNEGSYNRLRYFLIIV